MIDMLMDFRRFLNEVWREVRPGKGLVTWPSLEQVRGSTIIVILSTLLLSGFIFVCDRLLFYVRAWLMAG